MQFGNVHNAQNDAYSFDATHTSLISSLAFLGKFIGCLLAGTGIEMFGHRIVFFSLSIISFIGIIGGSSCLCPLLFSG